MRMPCDRPAVALLSVLWLTLSVARAQDTAGGGSRAGAPAPPPPVPTTYQFDHDVIAAKAEDQDRDGKPDAWGSYRRGHIVKFELDTDHDGQPDWRETFPPPGDAPWRQFYLRHIDGRWRLIPYNQFQVIHGEKPFANAYRGKVEKRVGGKWVDTFDDVGVLHYQRSTGEREALEDFRVEVKWKFVGGKPSEALISYDGHYERINWENGLPASSAYETAPDRLSIVETYRGGEQIAQLRYDSAGAPTYRQTVTPGGVRQEAFRDGSWTGDFVDELRDDRGRVFNRTTYRDGRQTLHEQINEETGALRMRRRYDPDGAWVFEQLDATTGEPKLRTSYDRTGAQERSEKWVDGRWTGDFEEGGGTFRGGRMVKVEQPGAGDETRRVGVFPDDLHEEWGDGKTTRLWLTHARDPDGGKHLAREERDLDGDGVPDLKVDYETLKVEQPENSRPNPP